MKTTPLKILLILIFSFFLIFSCKEDEVIKPDDEDENVQKDDSEDVDENSNNSDSTKNLAANRMINRWIVGKMEKYYLWEDQLPYPLSATTDNPEDFFYGLLTENDRWSYYVDDFEDYFSDFQGTPTSVGYKPQFYKYSNSDGVYILVKYVYNNSPADRAGIKRGDIITSIDGIDLDLDNYYDLYSQDNYTVRLGQFEDGYIGETDVEYSLVAEEIEANPIVHHEVLDLDGIKTGYLVYTDFVAGENNYYLRMLNDVFEEFASSGVSEIIVDLRYNPGGDGAAARHLASLLAPQNTTNNEEVLIEYVYNDFLTEYFQNDKDRMYVFYDSGLPGLSLDNVYFLVTEGSASSSELVITGLMPYINTTLIGESTHGKYTGMYVLENEDYNVGMLPVSFKYKNANGYTDFVDGLAPDYEMEDDLFNAVPFGDTSDPFLAKAIELITGEVATTVSLKSADYLRRFERIEPKEFDKFSNLVIDKRKVEK
jgi:carboxyl-terminal processing protease